MNKCFKEDEIPIEDFKERILEAPLVGNMLKSLFPGESLDSVLDIFDKDKNGSIDANEIRMFVTSCVVGTVVTDLFLTVFIQKISEEYQKIKSETITDIENSSGISANEVNENLEEFENIKSNFDAKKIPIDFIMKYFDDLSEKMKIKAIFPPEILEGILKSLDDDKDGKLTIENFTGLTGKIRDVRSILKILKVLISIPKITESDKKKKICPCF